MEKSSPKAYIAAGFFWLAFCIFFIWASIGEINRVGIQAGVWLIILIPLTISILYVLISNIRKLRKQ